MKNIFLTEKTGLNYSNEHSFPNSAKVFAESEIQRKTMIDYINKESKRKEKLEQDKHNQIVNELKKRNEMLVQELKQKQIDSNKEDKRFWIGFVVNAILSLGAIAISIIALCVKY